MTTFRPGNHHGVTIVAENDGARCGLHGFDHHGYCQEHGWLDDGKCPHFRAKELL